MKLNSKYTWLWVVWIAAFGVIEYSALKNKKEGDTLSEHVWKAIGTDTPGRSWKSWLGRGVLLGGFIWIIPHFFTGWNF